MSSQTAPLTVSGLRENRAWTVTATARPALTVLACTLLVKLVATGKEFVVAGAFGRSDGLDAFLAAFLVPGLLINLVAESMSQALVPELIRVRMQHGIESARELLAVSFTRLCLMLLAVCVAAEVAAPLWIRLVGWSFPPEKRALTLQMAAALLPFVLLGGVAATCGSVLNTTQRYAAPVIAPGIIPIITVIAVAGFAGRIGSWALVAASLTGAAIYAAWMLLATSRAGYPIRLRWSGAEESRRVIWWQQRTVLASSLVASGGLLADQAMAASLAPGSVASLAFAGRFVSVALTVAAGVASAVVGPHVATLAAKRDWLECRAALRRWSVLAWTSSATIAIVLILGSDALVRICLQHGAFGAGDSAAVSRVLAFSALQIPFFAASRVHYRFLLAARRADLILLCGTVNLVLDVALNLVLMRTLGVAGIAFSTALWTFSTWLFLLVCTRRVLLRAEAERGDV